MDGYADRHYAHYFVFAAPERKQLAGLCPHADIVLYRRFAFAAIKASRIISIRPISTADHAGIVRINLESRPAVAAMDEAELRRLLALGGIYLVAIDSDETIVGYLLAFAKSDPYDGEEFRYFTAKILQPFLYVDQIAMLGRAQRRGIGRKLYQSLSDHGKDRGISVLCCEVNTSPPNVISQEFHARLGFTQIDALNLPNGRAVALLICTVLDAAAV